MRSWILGIAPAVCATLAAAEPATVGAGDPSRLRPFWLSETMDGESVLFVRERDGELPRASLCFGPTGILAVRSASGEVTYAEGQDFTWEAGRREIRLPPTSRIPFRTPADLRRPAGSQPYRLTHRDGNGEIWFGAGHEYHDLQTVVTYRHGPGDWPQPLPAFAGDRLPQTLRRLDQHQPLTIVLFGDSISTGCNASGWAKVPPLQPPYQDLLVAGLTRVFGGPVTLTNLAVGGMDSAWGAANIGKVVEAKPDLVILAFGMNDAGGRPAADFQAKTKAMMEAVRQARPQAEVILVATMLGNPDWVTLHQDLFPQYRDALAALCGPGVALADLTSVWTELLRRKRDWDLTGNGVNHPNDFGHRVYAQVLLSLLCREPQAL